MKATRPIERLPHYFYAFATINSLIFICFAAFIIHQSKSIQESERLLSQYHLPLATTLQQVEHELINLKNTWRPDTAEQQNTRDLLYQIDTRFQQIWRMQQQYSNTLTENLRQRYDTLIHPTTNSTFNHSLEKVLISTRQIRLLNQQKTEKLFANLSKEQKKTSTLMVVATASAVLLGILLFTRILTLIKKAITRQQKAERELVQHRQHLEDEVQLRTRELEVSNSELEAYSYSIAHDLRAPLRSITSFSQIVMEDAQDYLKSDDKDHLQRVINGAQRMAKLIDDLLTIARITRSKLSLSNINLSEMAEEILHGFHNAEPLRKVDWEIQANMTAHVDAEMLRLALSNLLDNAWKYTAKTNEPNISFGCNQEKDVATFYIKDNGAGFDMQYVDKLFISFQRLHSPDEFAGSGVGLATVARIIHRHNGNIWAEAEVDKGATFYFTLKAATPR